MISSFFKFIRDCLFLLENRWAKHQAERTLRKILAEAVSLPVSKVEVRLVMATDGASYPCVGFYKALSQQEHALVCYILSKALGPSVNTPSITTWN